jgi:acyl-CoA synthetase (AMP-forming)/AMP-acid ligase II
VGFETAWPESPAPDRCMQPPTASPAPSPEAEAPTLGTGPDLRGGATLPLALVRACRLAGGRLKVADSLGTRLSGRALLIRILCAMRVLERVLAPDEQAVGIMLPPTAGRVAVNLNYTTSQQTLDLSIERAGLRHVLTSPAFLARVKLAVGSRLLDATELKSRLTTFDTLVAATQATCLPLGILERVLGLNRLRAADVLTVIFTSGSTGDPKGVVLSEENVASNVRAIGQILHVSSADVVLGVLPFFHSYGYTATFWAPLVLDAAVVYHANPLDAQAIGALAREHHATILMATPTFLRTYLRRTPAEDFSTLEVVFGSAEKLPREVSDAFEAKFGVRPSEAYGATEMSPLIAANIPPARHVRARVTTRDDVAPLPVGSEGMLWITGPNVMQGYLDRPDLTAQVIHDGWYCTGDIAKLDEDGFITITGRESRFSKIGGEMVPHLPVEEAVNAELGSGDGELMAVVAGVPDARKGERLVVLHLKTGRDPYDICRGLAARGLPNLWIPTPDSFAQVEAIPVLGSGKLDLRWLATEAAERFQAGGGPS